MDSSFRLTELERQVLLKIPELFPEGDSLDLKFDGADEEAISHAIRHLIGLGLMSASSHEGVNPFAPYYRDVELTTKGEQMRRDLERCGLLRWLETEWKWLVSTAIGGCALALSMWNFFHASGK